MTILKTDIEALKTFIDTAVYSAERQQSKIKLENLLRNLKGSSSERLRHLLNNLCSLEGTGYLELGAYRGASVCSAMYQNVGKADIIDNFKTNYYQPIPYKEEGWIEVESSLKDNLKRYGLTINVNIIKSDIEKLSPTDLKSVYNVCYYDIDKVGNSYNHLKKVYAKFSSVFIMISNFCRLEGTSEGIEKVFKENNATVHKLVELKSKHAEDAVSWWSGVKVWLVEKNKKDVK